MIRLIASDMDGTLLNSKKEFDDEFFNILQELLNKEIYFVIASGNQFHHLYNNFYHTVMICILLVKMVLLSQKGKKNFIHLLWINMMFKQFMIF